MTPSILKLIACIEDLNSTDVSLKDVRVLTKSQDPEVIDVLAGLLDDDGRIGREAVRALRRFGRAAETTLRRCLGSHNETVVAQAQELLATLGETPETETPELTALSPGNDNEVGAEPDLTLLADREVVRSIGAVLRARGVPRQEVDDGVAEVQTRVMELLRLGPAPANLAEWRTLANKVAAELAIDILRKRLARRKHEEDLCEDPDAFASESVPMWHPIDAKRMIEVFRKMVGDGGFRHIECSALRGAHGLIAGAGTGCVDREKADGLNSGEGPGG